MAIPIGRLLATPAYRRRNGRDVWLAAVPKITPFGPPQGAQEFSNYVLDQTSAIQFPLALVSGPGWIADQEDLDDDAKRLFPATRQCVIKMSANAGETPTHLAAGVLYNWTLPPTTGTWIGALLTSPQPPYISSYPASWAISFIFDLGSGLMTGVLDQGVWNLPFTGGITPDLSHPGSYFFSAYIPWTVGDLTQLAASVSGGAGLSPDGSTLFFSYAVQAAIKEYAFGGSGAAAQSGGTYGGGGGAAAKIGSTRAELTGSVGSVVLNLIFDERRDQRVVTVPVTQALGTKSTQGQFVSAGYPNPVDIPVVAGLKILTVSC